MLQSSQEITGENHPLTAVAMNTIHFKNPTGTGATLLPVFQDKTNTRNNTMKKTIKKTLYIACVAAIFAACVITNEAGDPCMWNYVLLAFAGLTGGAAKRMEVAR